MNLKLIATSALIISALMLGAFAERIRFSAYLVFITIWLFVVYVPLAHMVWGGGWIGSQLGALVAPRYSYIEPNVVFSPELSFIVVVMALLGGIHRLWGPLVGVIPFTLIWEGITISFPNYTTLFLGFSFLLIVYFLPHGVVGLVQSFVRRVGR